MDDDTEKMKEIINEAGLELELKYLEITSGDYVEALKLACRGESLQHLLRGKEMASK